MTETFFGHVDLAQITLYLFWIFFAGLVVYLQRENSREGYPLEEEDGRGTKTGVFGLPRPKTFQLPAGRGTYTVPNDERETRTFAMQALAKSNGSPYEPTGDPLADGIGPAAYAIREDRPEIDGSGHAKIQPLKALPDHGFFAGRDPRGMPVVSADGEVVGTVVDMWIDVPEMMVRYLEIELATGGTRLAPMPLSKITNRGVKVRSLRADQFAGVPEHAQGTQITKLEEERISAYYTGGTLYAARNMVESELDPLLA